MNLQEQINFEVFKVLLEAKSGFRIDEFKAIDDEDFTNPIHAQEKRLAYARTHLKTLGAGSSRIVFLLSNRFVLKMAQPRSNEFGKSQNRKEVDVFTNPEIAPIVTKVYESDPEYNWIISELVRPVNDKNEFQQLTGLDFETFSNLLSAFSFSPPDNVQKAKAEIEERIAEFKDDLESIKSQPPERQKWMRSETMDRMMLYVQMLDVLDHPIVSATLNLMSKGGVSGADLKRLEHWGKTAEGRVVILDYGYTG